MSQSQEFRANPDEAVVKKAVKVTDENLELTHSNSNQQMRSSTVSDAVYTAYDALNMHKSYQRSFKSFNEEQHRYEEQAYTSEQPQQPVNTAQTTPVLPAPVQEPAENSADPTQAEPALGGIPPDWKSPALREMEGKRDPFRNTLSLGQAETPAMWTNTHELQKNQKLQEKLESRRKDVQRGYTRFSLKYGEDELSTNPKVKFNYYGRLNISGAEQELTHIGRLKYNGQIRREKMTRKDYERLQKKKEKKGFKRRVKGRLLFRETKALVEDEDLAEDDTVGRMKRITRNTGRMAAASTRRNIRTVRLQNNTYYRLELAHQHEQVLKDKRTKLLTDAKRKEQKKALREAKTREQKRKLKKQMVQQRAKVEGNFIRRARQNRLVKRRAKDYRRKVRKRTLTTIFSLAGIILFFLLLLMVLFLVLVAMFAGGSDFYAATVTQNDYSTITEATEYFRKLETDMDEYLNGDRDELEAEIEAEYGDEIYEYIYELADFGFSANTLIAYLSATYGSFTLDDIKDELESLFEEMYTLTIDVKVEDREISTYDPASGEWENVTVPKNICYIILEKKELEEIVDERLPEDARFQYDGYKLATGGQQVYAPVMREDWTNLISSNFGDRIHPITKERKTHNGVDIAVPTETKIYSPIKGTVILAAYSNSAGNWVKVQTDTGWTVVMMHMDSLAVSAGQSVEQGDFLGFSGNTGNSTGPHLHLEVRDPDYRAINPIFIIPQTCAGIGKEAEE
ncbi:MAG: peptidoglycan DD-metalloendopeptidase family protein [Lachnospiraceae bacterium]|nr:peptidoglycan DD-metalloendopeptidase family protein [Lachnospiraceae bacterium]